MRAGWGIAPPFGLQTTSERDADCNSGTAGISAVEQVITVVVVIHVHVVCLIPVRSPVLGIGIEQTEPIAAVLEARVSADHHEGHSVDAEPVSPTVVAAEIVVRDSVAVVPATLPPTAVLLIPPGGAMLLPDTLLLRLLLALLLL